MNLKNSSPDDHAFLSPSKYHWLYYDDEKLINSWRNYRAAQRGTELHAFAADAIGYGVKLSRSKATLNSYVNDAIGYGMKPEHRLYYSDNCFGTSDALLFDEKKKLLRIHDLKTGTTPAHMEQLYIYAALYCLEHGIDPVKIDIETRIYQSDDVITDTPTGNQIREVADIIRHHDKVIEKLKTEEA